MNVFFRLARWVVLVCGLLLVNVQAQENAKDDFALKISPSALFRLDWLNTSGVGLQLGVQAQGELPHQGGAIFFDGALWFSPPTLGLAVLEFYEALKLDDLEFSFGKRAKLVGPWREGTLGQDGLPGLFVGYRLEEGVGLEGALVFENGLLRTYLGANLGMFELGLLLRPSLTPRVVFRADIFSLGLQTDRGVWGIIDLPVYLLEGIPLTLGCTVWWQPGFADDGNGGRIFVTQRFFLSLSARVDQAGFGFDVVRAPLEAYRLWLEYRLKW